MDLLVRQSRDIKLFLWGDVGREKLISSPVSATIGVFDGLHRGHQVLLSEVLKESGSEPLVVTFRESPKRVLNPGYSGDLMTWDEKVQTLVTWGITNIVVIDFSWELSRMTGKEFFLRLKNSFSFSRLVLGWNFSFGKDAATSASDLGWLADPGTKLFVQPPVYEGGRLVSSSAIRQAIVEGNLLLANELLGRNYHLASPKHQEWREGRIQVRNAEFSKLLPPTGVYPCRIDGEMKNISIQNEVTTWESPPGKNYHEIVFI